MIAFMASLLVRRTGLPQAGARLAAWAILGILAVLLAWAAWSALKGAIITNHDNGQRADQAEAQLKRQNAADEDQLPRLDRIESGQANLQGAIDNAVTAEPEAAARPVGPGAGAAIGELWRRQQAAERGQSPDPRADRAARKDANPRAVGAVPR